MIEGATLGGRELSRLLSPMLDALGLVAPEGRRFFLAYGAAQGPMWRRFCDVLDTAAATIAPAGRRDMEAAARSTFLIMEDWLTRCQAAA